MPREPTGATGRRKPPTVVGSYPERMSAEALSLFGVACAFVIFIAAAIIIVFL
jgi:hypothetical protein